VVDDPLLDTVVNGRYHVVRKLGEGGMSVVYEVQHVKLKRQFALKRLLPQLMRNEEAMIRFEREAELLSSLRHPHVVDIIDWDILDDETPFMVLEFLHGAHIRVRLDRAPLSWEAVARLGDQTMSALALAHRIGITHRDLKPENLFISIDDSGEERVKLLDFGVSKMRGLGRTTGQHALLGTPSYMSPEQAQGLTDLIGPSTDVWAMGAILYEMATSKIAFTGATLLETVVNITQGRPVDMRQFRADAPPAFVDLVDRAINPDPERRITTIEELRAGLKQALEPRQRIVTPLGGMPALSPSHTTPPPTTSRLTPIPGSTVSPATPMTSAPTSSSAIPGLYMSPLTAPSGASLHDSKPRSAARNWIIIASTAVLAIAGTLAVVFAVT
jgi:eukaryotic-like serine/threonine-protein kinase